MVESGGNGHALGKLEQSHRRQRTARHAGEVPFQDRRDRLLHGQPQPFPCRLPNGRVGAVLREDPGASVHRRGAEVQALPSRQRRGTSRRRTRAYPHPREAEEVC